MKIQGGILQGGVYQDQTIVHAGLVEWLDATDYSGTGSTWPARVGNDATLYGSPTYTSAEPTYLNFDPAGLQYADTASLGDLNTWTAEVWFNQTQSLVSYLDPALVSTVYLDGAISTGEVNFTIAQGSGSGGTNTLIAGYYNGGSPGWNQTTPPYTPTVGAWAQAVGTFDGTNIALYINSSQVATGIGSGPASANGGPFRIARRWDSAYSQEYLFPAEIATIRIYNRALSSAEVAQNWNAERGRFGL